MIVNRAWPRVDRVRTVTAPRGFPTCHVEQASCRSGRSAQTRARSDRASRRWFSDTALASRSDPDGLLQRPRYLAIAEADTNPPLLDERLSSGEDRSYMLAKRRSSRYGARVLLHVALWCDRRRRRCWIGPGLLTTTENVSDGKGRSRASASTIWTRSLIPSQGALRSVALRELPLRSRRLQMSVPTARPMEMRRAASISTALRPHPISRTCSSPCREYPDIRGRILGK